MGTRIRRGIAMALFAASLMVAAPALADEYDPESSGHVLRIAAYVVHPVGVLIDTLIFRPAHWIVHHQPLRTLFGHTH